MELAPSWNYDGQDLKLLRSKIEEEREQQLESSRKLQERWQDELNAARKQLQEMNKVSSRDTAETTGRRAVVHARIAGLEQSIKDKEDERERMIPAGFEVKLAKLRLIETWPERRAEVAREVEAGRARERKHGDVEDIGYRKFFEDREDQEKDVEVGENAARQLMAEGRIPREFPDSDIQYYVQQLSSRIALSSDLKVPLHVAVVDSPDIHPIALPGGYLFLSSGLIRATRTEAELAGVVSREVARIAARHGARASKAPLISRIFAPVAHVATGLFTGGVTSPGAYYGITYGVQGLSTLVDRAVAVAPSRYQREADQLGIQYAWKAGFDPKGFISFLDSISGEETLGAAAGPPADSTREELGKRLLAAFSEIAYLPPREKYDQDSPEFRAARERLQEDHKGALSH
jgi:hypothetical protein